MPAIQKRMSSVLPSGKYWDNIFDNMLNKGSSKAFVPRMKAVEEEDVFVLSAELPGFTAEEVEITYENSFLTLKAEKKKKEKKKKEKVVFDEISSVSFSRSFLVEDIDSDAISATMKDGILQVSLPKNTDSKTRKIEIS